MSLTQEQIDDFAREFAGGQAFTKILIAAPCPEGLAVAWIVTDPYELETRQRRDELGDRIWMLVEVGRRSAIPWKKEEVIP